MEELKYNGKELEIYNENNLFKLKFKDGTPLNKQLQGSWTSPILAKSHVVYAEALRKKASGEDIVRKPKTMEQAIKNEEVVKEQRKAKAAIKKLTDPANLGKKTRTRKTTTTKEQ